MRLQFLFATVLLCCIDEASCNNCKGDVLPDSGVTDSLRQCPTNPEDSKVYRNNAFWWFKLPNSDGTRKWVNIQYDIDIESSTMCSADKLEFVSSWINDVIVCGIQTASFSLPINPGFSLQIFFSSNRETEGTGFTVEYNTTSLPVYTTTDLPRFMDGTGDSVCTVKLNETRSGTVDGLQLCGEEGSTTYPNVSLWTFFSCPVDQDTWVNIEYDLDLQSHEWCEKDKVTLGVIDVDNERTEEAVLCGTQTGTFSYRIKDGESMLIRFVSDASVTGTGFKIQYSIDDQAEFPTEPPDYDGIEPTVAPSTVDTLTSNLDSMKVLLQEKTDLCTELTQNIASFEESLDEGDRLFTSLSAMKTKLSVFCDAGDRLRSSITDFEENLEEE